MFPDRKPPSVAYLQDSVSEKDQAYLRNATLEQLLELREGDPDRTFQVASEALDSKDESIRYQAALFLIDRVLLEDPEQALSLYKKAFTDNSADVRNAAYIYFLNSLPKPELDIDAIGPILELIQEHYYGLDQVERILPSDSDSE